MVELDGPTQLAGPGPGCARRLGLETTLLLGLEPTERRGWLRLDRTVDRLDEILSLDRLLTSVTVCYVNTPPRSFSRGVGAESVPRVPVMLRAVRSGVGRVPSSMGRMHLRNCTRARGFVMTSGIMLVVDTHWSMMSSRSMQSRM